MTTEKAFERFVEALNGPASAAELAAEAEVVATMHGLVSPATGVGVILKTILGHKIAAAVAATAIGTSGAAAASGNVPFLVEESAPTEVVAELGDVDEAQPVVEPVAEPEAYDEEIVEAIEEEVEPEDDEAVLPPVDENGEAYGDVDCDEASSHGEYVSSVAKDDSIDGPRGHIVRQAAQTDCGKSDGGDEETDLEETDLEESELEEDDLDIDDEEADEAFDDDDDRQGNGNRNGSRNNGNGNGNGNGK